MNIDVEKLRDELKNMVDDVINRYLSSSKTLEIKEDDNTDTLIEINDEKIYMEFELNGYNYVAFSKDSYEIEELEMLFAKVENIDGNQILRNIESTEEYQSVINEFNRRLQLISD